MEHRQTRAVDRSFGSAGENDRIRCVPAGCRDELPTWRSMFLPFAVRSQPPIRGY